MLLSKLSFVGYGVGSESFDSVFNDTARERWTSPPGDAGCPLNADCNGVPGGDAMSGGSVSGAGLLNQMDGFHRDKYWKTNTIWIAH
jgi:hypothetical protein